MSQDENDLHRQRMARQKEAFEERKARATREQGLLIVHTGAGKGKTTAALGLAFRALGQGLRVGIIQFIKGAIPTGEAALAARLGELLPLTMHTMGDGFTWNTQDREQDVASARRAWERAVALLRDPAFDVIILDELNVVLRHGYLLLDEVLDELRARRPMLHVVVTGRNAPEGLTEMADLVTEMKLIKHPYRSGVKAQKGIEF
jgi:cob(I)alamin adenosyltransferase